MAPLGGSCRARIFRRRLVAESKTARGPLLTKIFHSGSAAFDSGNHCFGPKAHLHWGLRGLGGAATGVGYALLSLLWARALWCWMWEELEAVVPLSSLVIVPCVVVYPLLEGVVGVVATALLPLMSGVLLLLCLREGAKRGGVEEAASSVGGMSPYLKDSEASGAASASSGAGASLSRRFGIAESWGFYLGRVAVVLVVLYLAIGWQAAGRCPRQHACAHRS